MIKKILFFTVAVFGLSSVADMHSDSGMDHMSDMAGVSEENGNGPHGAIEVKYKYDIESKGDIKSYRARIGWKGEVNDVVKWGVGVTTTGSAKGSINLENARDAAAAVLTGDTQAATEASQNAQKSVYYSPEQPFNGPKVVPIGFDTAYVAYSPVEGFVIKAGKWAWEPSFHKSGILYDDDLYQEGFFAKYMYGDKEESYTYVKAAVNWLDGAYQGGLFGDRVLWGKVGGSYAISDGVMGSVYAGGVYGGLVKGNDTVLMKAGVGLSVSSTPVPLGFYAVYLNNKDFKDHSYSAGVFVGGADKASATEKGDFGVAVSYHKVKDTAYNTTFLDDDYNRINEGVTARAQYNLWENSNVVAKYAHGLGDAKNNSVVTGEVTFNF